MDGSLRTFNILLGMTLLVLVLIFYKQLNLQISEILVLLFVFSRSVPTYISFANNFTRVFQKIPIYLSLTSRQKILQNNEEIFGDKYYKSNSIMASYNKSEEYSSILQSFYLKYKIKILVSKNDVLY